MQNALLKAGTNENNHNMNVYSQAISVTRGSMEELESYKRYFEREDGITYYDPFKNKNDRKDSMANVNRKTLHQFWNDSFEMWESNELPRDFESQNQWINVGITYGKLVEPLQSTNAISNEP